MKFRHFYIYPVFLYWIFPNNSCPPCAPIRVKLVPSLCRAGKCSKMVSFETENFEEEAKSCVSSKTKSYGSHQTVFECTNEDEETKLCLTPQKAPQIYAALAACLGGYNVGCSESWSSPVQPQLQRNATIDDDVTSIWYLQLTEQQMSWAGSLINIGALFGAICGGLLMDKFGRRATIMAVTAPYVIGWLFIIFATNSMMIYIGRLVCGFAAGICTTAVPCYIGEISTPNIRGLLGVFFTVTTGAGFLLSSILAWLDWRLISVILGIQSFLMLFSVYFVPESPYFLVHKGRLVEAEKALIWLRGPNYNVTPELIHIEKRVAKDLERKTSTHFTDIFHSWAMKPILIGVAMMVFLHFSAFGVAEFYTIEIFQMSGTNLDSKTCAILLNAVQVVAAVISSVFLVEQCGRRALFLVSEFFACLTICVLGGYFYVLEHDPETAHALRWLPLTSLILFIAAINIGVVPLAFVVSNEVLPDRLKGTGSAIASFFDWLLCFIVTKTFVDLQLALGHDGTFWFYGSFCFVGILFGLFFQPETRGKTSDEIQAMFQKTTTDGK